MRFNYQKKISKEHDNVELQTFGEHLDVLRKMLFRISALSIFIPNRSLEKASCHFLMTAIRKTASYMLDS